MLRFPSLITDEFVWGDVSSAFASVAQWHLASQSQSLRRSLSMLSGVMSTITCGRLGKHDCGKVFVALYPWPTPHPEQISHLILPRPAPSGLLRMVVDGSADMVSQFHLRRSPPMWNHERFRFLHRFAGIGHPMQFCLQQAHFPTRLCFKP